MRRSFVGTTAVATLAFAVACGDLTQSSTAPVRFERPRGAAIQAPVPGTCVTVSQLIAFANAAFGAGSPNANSVIGKISNLDHRISVGNFAEAKAHAFTIVDFVLDKNAEGGLPGTQQDIVNLVNGVLCFAGLPMQITDANSFLVFPSDEAQVLQVPGIAGTSLPPNPVSEPTLITITPIPDTFPEPGAGPLDTKLDQYPGFAALHKSSETNAPFTQPVVVAVCADPGIPAAVRARLRLGHDASTGFELTPPADASFLQCPTSIAQTGLRKFFGKLANLVLPRVLYARQEDFSGGVGGTAGEYSDFGPVDGEASLSGGVGGTAGEYLRAAMSASLTGGCAVVEAPVGSPLGADCLPLLTIATALGTPLTGVPIQWTVTAGGGQIAPRSNGVCGTFGSTAQTVTSAFGKTGICWTLGTAGANSVVATPSAGGDAPEGVVFNPATVTFNATANPPVGVVFTQQPPANVIAGAPFDVTAMIVDKNGTQVMGSSAAVTLTPNQNSFAGGVPSISVNAAQGIATFSGLQITTAANGYTLSATSAVITAPNVPPVSDAFNVLAGAAFSMTIVQGNNQTGAAGSTLPINPTVRIADQYNNPVSGVAVSWLPGLSSSGSVGASPTSTGSDGRAFTTWTIGDGANQLTATVGGIASLTQVFDANGTNTMGILNQCLPGGSGDPINDAGKPYAFYIPNPGKNKTIREIQVYLSSTGKANAPTPYQIQLTTQLGTFDPAVSAPIGTTATVSLRGNNSEQKLTTFTLSTPIVGTQNGPDVMIRLNVLTNPDGSKINFNTGECSPGTNCRPARGCSVTEVSSPTPFPAGTAYRKSVALTVKGG